MTFVGWIEVEATAFATYNPLHEDWLQWVRAGRPEDNPCWQLFYKTLDRLRKLMKRADSEEPQDDSSKKTKRNESKRKKARDHPRKYQRRYADDSDEREPSREPSRKSRRQYDDSEDEREPSRESLRKPRK